MEEAAQGASLRAPQALAVVDATDSPGERVRWLPAVRSKREGLRSHSPPHLGHNNVCTCSLRHIR